MKDLHEFSSDRPINKIEEDLLGRAGFSKDLADAIASWHGNDSLVVALHGDWGSGKSSIKNMAISELESITKNKPDIIEFTPWEWAAQEKITASFFKEISTTLGLKNKGKDGKKLALLLKKYGRYLTTGEELTTGISSALPMLFILAATLGLGGSITDEVWVKSITTPLLSIIVAWAAALTWGKSFLNILAGNVDATVKGNELTLSELRAELNRLLSKKTNSLVIVMDDIDRLTSAQLRMVFQLIKANTEFPNVVFLLLFQRDLVEDKLNDGKQTGRDYLEKIIQVPFDIPKIETSRLHNLLFTKIDRILEQDKTVTEKFDSGYWGNVFYSSLYVYFYSLRNVYRFSSTFSFHFSLLRGRRVFEANPVDLIALECIRLFEPDVYKEMARSKQVLTKNGSDRYDGSDKSTPQLLESIIAKSTEGKNEYVKKLIELLFPTIQWALGGTHYGNDFSGRWLREVRICHPSNFDKYFQFSIPSGELSNSDLREMLALTSNTESLSSFILTLQERGILMNALSQFDAYTDKIPLKNAESYIRALLDIGDKVDHEFAGFAMSNSYTNVVRLVIWFLKRIESQEERGRLLLTCFQASNGIAVVERILQADESHRDSSEGDIVFADNEYFNLKKEFVRKLDEMAGNSPDILMSHGHLVSFLFRWKHWGDKTKVCLWLQQQIATEKGCLHLLRAFVSKMYSQGDGDYTSKITSYIKLEDIENFVSIIKIQEKINGIDDESLDEKSKEAIEAFEKALDQRNKGLKDEW